MEGKTQDSDMVNTMKEESRQSMAAFLLLVGDAQQENPGTPLVRLMVSGSLVDVRIKRAKTTANQINVWREEILAIHLSEDDAWVVLSPKEQLVLARGAPGQHGSLAIDNISIHVTRLKQISRVVTSPKDLEEELERAKSEASDPYTRISILAIRETRAQLQILANNIVEGIAKISDEE